MKEAVSVKDQEMVHVTKKKKKNLPPPEKHLNKFEDAAKKTDCYCCFSEVSTKLTRLSKKKQTNDWANWKVQIS